MTVSALTAGALALGLAAGTAAQDRGAITVASTTSTESSGLFESIIPQFEEATGIEVRVVAVGTGQALEIGCRGDADAVLVHAPDAEREFVDEGCGVDRREVMYNDFIVVGPAEDPADAGGAGSAVEAFRRIAEAEAPFASRGDDSGTNKKELSIWAEAGIEPAGRWYRELGSGMGATLNTAAGMDAYTLADRGTWISFDNRQNLEIVYEGDEILFNQYGSILVNPERHDINHELAQEWHDWLVSEEGQEAIGAYRLRGQQLFTPNAE
ncbi:sulfate transporter [Spiribacter halobius]|uniref:Sulfate transporter n=2 Tax=Sediminicurvatus halobius TaxID=2182432 RepID=A0A2U2MZB9_9GAMM|nr:sulfate transporter [Spiribacter halobius]